MSGFDVAQYLSMIIYIFLNMAYLLSTIQTFSSLYISMSCFDVDESFKLIMYIFNVTYLFLILQTILYKIGSKIIAVE